jgi:DNA-binding response OmpR family regulator
MNTLIIGEHFSSNYILQNTLSKNGLNSLFYSSKSIIRLGLPKLNIIIINSKLSKETWHALDFLFRSSESQFPILIYTKQDEEVIEHLTQLNCISRCIFLTEMESTHQLLELIQEFSNNKHKEIKIGTCTFHPNRFTLIHEDKKTQLTQKEKDLLCLLAKHKGRIVKREEIISSAWKQKHINPNTVDVYVSRLRKKLGKNKRHLKTIACVGYELI